MKQSLILCMMAFAFTSTEAARLTVSSDPVFGSLGPRKCESSDFANEEQRLMDKLKNSTPREVVLDEDVGPSTLKSIKWAEKSVGSELKFTPGGF